MRTPRRWAGGDGRVPDRAGDASDDEVLLRAGLERAAGLTTCVATDADNVFVTLSARALNPRLPIVARALDQGVVPKLRRAGATQVISPYAMAGRHIARRALHPAKMDLMEVLLGGDGGTPPIGEVAVVPGSALASMTVAEVRRHFPEVSMLAVQRGDRVLTPLPARSGSPLGTPLRRLEPTTRSVSCDGPQRCPPTLRCTAATDVTLRSCRR
jgi:Trk K+ transport system NAD-binding subunit